MKKRFDLHDWNEGIQRVIHEIDGPALLPTLMGTLKTIVQYDEWFVAMFRKDAPPIVVDYSYADKMRDRYDEGPYLVDPFYNAFLDGIDPGCYTIRALAPRDFTSSEFYAEYYAPWGEGDEASFITPLDDNAAGSVSVMRVGKGGRFSPSELRFFRAAVPVVTAVMMRIWRRMQPEIPRDENFGTDFHLRMTQAFHRFGTSVLTEREAEITHLLLRGHSAKSVARLLGISPGTVRNHMKSIYAKLGISSHSELFGLFFEALASAGSDLTVDPLLQLRRQETA